MILTLYEYNLRKNPASRTQFYVNFLLAFGNISHLTGNVG
jgi:hypothetical protein